MKSAGKFIAVVAMLSMAASAYADSANGAYVGGGIGVYQLGAKISIPASSITLNLSSSTPDIGLNLYGGYKFNMGKGSLAVEASYNSGIGKNAEFSVPGSVMSGSLTNNWSASVLPGYNLTPDTTSYLRLGYIQAKGEQKGTTPSTHTFTGYVVGFGVDQAVSSNLGVRLEYRLLTFSSWTDPTNSTTEVRSSGMDLSVRYAF